MWYVGMRECRAFAFPYIHENLTAGEPAPMYEHEVSGM